MSRTVIYAHKRLHWQAAKTALGVIRYRPQDVIAVIDPDHAGQTVAEALGIDIGHDIPVVRDVQAALPLKPDTFLVGISPSSHSLSDDLRQALVCAIEARLNLVNGLHIFLADEPELSALAAANRVEIWDVRRPPVDMKVAHGTAHPPHTQTVLAVGSDCCIGKKTVMIELDQAARQRGWRSSFLATGQTGIMIAGDGIPTDHTPSDFLAGLIEDATLRHLERAQWLFVEGQGALNHHAYANISLGLLMGSAPDLLIVCHDPRATTLTGYPDRPLPPLLEVVRMNEEASNWGRGGSPAKAAGISLITEGMEESQARKLLLQVEDATGLPTVDCIRFGVGSLLDSLARFNSPLHLPLHELGSRGDHGAVS